MSVQDDIGDEVGVTELDHYTRHRPRVTQIYDDEYSTLIPASRLVLRKWRVLMMVQPYRRRLMQTPVPGPPPAHDTVCDSKDDEHTCSRATSDDIWQIWLELLPERLVIAGIAVGITIVGWQDG